MIETLEQYNAYKNGGDMVVHVGKHGKVVANSRNEAIETIEALRNVARAADEHVVWGYKEVRSDLRQALDALPAWVLEENDG